MSTSAAEIAVHYNAGAYRLHGDTCRDREREQDEGVLYPAGTSLAEIARAEFADFIDEDPDYYTDATVLAEFEASARVLPCAAALIG
jgi:hypothetical protein